jgi:predicted lipoprotein with Yx(FWY)xxD motif
MQLSKRILLGVGVGVAVVGAGAGFAAASSSSSPVTKTAQTSFAPAGSATINVTSASVAGKSEQILVDAKGLPLYTYAPDTATTSHVSGGLAALWPPLVSTSPTESGATGTLSVVTDSNGHQVQYNGHFLYTFVDDTPGHVTGQGVQNFFVATPGPSSGIMSTAAAPASQQSGGYGY